MALPTQWNLKLPSAYDGLVVTIQNYIGFPICSTQYKPVYKDGQWHVRVVLQQADQHLKRIDADSQAGSEDEVDTIDTDGPGPRPGGPRKAG